MLLLPLQDKVLQYNKSKAYKFHMKLFTVSEKDTGYMISFSVYTGSNCNELVERNAAMDLNYSVTTKNCYGATRCRKFTRFA